jgi:hypothetical protein
MFDISVKQKCQKNKPGQNRRWPLATRKRQFSFTEGKFARAGEFERRGVFSFSSFLGYTVFR